MSKINLSKDFPGKEGILKGTFRIQRDFVQDHRYRVLWDDGSVGPIATICFTSTADPSINKILAELIVEGLMALKAKKA